MKKNIEQEKAIAQLEGPVILISCPGSGKTTTLLRRINHMLEVGIPPKKILMITFTKAAAQEMSVKFKKKFGEPNGITFSTIHALCLKILMTYGGLSAENIIKTSDQWKFLLETARKCQSVCDPAKAAGNFQMLYSAAMNNRMSPSEVNPKDIKGISRKDFLFMSDEYRRMKERTGYIDFDDMLVKAYELMTGNPQVLRQLRERWDYIQVDEYQDVNYLQRDLDYLLKDVGYEKYLREYAESLQQDFDEMKHMLSIYQRDSQKFHTMKEWLLYIKKRSMNLNNNNDQGVCLSTMHRSKGLEWKNVYIIDCNEGYIPPGSPDTPISQEEVEEERRLFYVAVTRAKERLFITYVGNKKGKPVSRFVRELQLKESGRAKTVKKNDMVRHKTYGVCMVLSVNGNKCTIRSLSDDRDAEVLVSSLDIR